MRFLNKAFFYKGDTCWSKIIALIRDTPGDIAFFVHDILRYYHLTEVGDKTKP